MKESPLPPAQEAQAQELAQAIAEAAADEFLQLARTLVAADRSSSLFGDTELKVRDLLLRVGVKTYQQMLEQKKTATKGAA